MKDKIFTITYRVVRTVFFPFLFFFLRIEFFRIIVYFRPAFYHGFLDLSNSILWRGLPCRGSTLASRKPSSGRSDRCDVLQGLGDEALNFGILSIYAT